MRYQAALRPDCTHSTSLLDQASPREQGDLRSVAIRLRFRPAEEGLAAQEASLAGFLIAHHPGNTFGVDVCGGMPAVMIKMLLYSEPGLVDLLPALPAQAATGAVLYEPSWKWRPTTVWLGWVRWAEAGNRPKPHSAP